MRRGGHRGVGGAVEISTHPASSGANPTGGLQVLPAGDDDYQHFRRLARVQGVEAAVKGFTKEELLAIMRRNGFTYINPRSRKVDLGYALMGQA